MKNFKTLSKRGLALFLALMMCVSLLPATAMAAELNDLSADGRELICGKEAHSHTEECYETVSDLICGVEESHVHGEDCYAPGEPVLACASDEEGHVHMDACYVPGERVLRCDKAEGHVHSEDCYTESKSETLICALEEHEHSEECYAPAEQETEVPEIPEIVIPEGATLVDPAWLLAANPNAGKAMLSAWNLFGLVRDNYQDVLGGNFPETLTFVGETVNETVWYEDTQEHDPAVIRVTGDAIIYNGEPVTVYFQGMIEGVDEPELLANAGSKEIEVGEQATLKSDNGSLLESKKHTWISDNSTIADVSGQGRSATVTGKAEGTVTITHSWDTYCKGREKHPAGSETFTVTVINRQADAEWTAHAFITNQPMTISRLDNYVKDSDNINTTQGVAVTNIAPDQKDHKFWMVKVQTGDQIQKAGNNEPNCINKGENATAIRCLNNTWEYYGNDGAWNRIPDGAQLTFYYRNYTQLSNGVSLEISDWPLITDHPNNTLLTGVVYQVYDSNGNVLQGGNSAVHYYYGLAKIKSVALTITSNEYEIEAVSVDHVSHDGTLSDSVVLEKIPNRFEELRWSKPNFNTDFEIDLAGSRDVDDDQIKSGHGVCVVGIKVKPIVTTESLTVRYLNDTDNKEIMLCIQFNARLELTTNKPTFNSFIQISSSSTEISLASNSNGATLADNMLEIPISLGGSKQLIPLHVSLPGYDPAYVRAVISSDGKTLNLYYQEIDKYAVTYRFESGTDGKTLPATGMPDLPTATEAYDGATVSAPVTSYQPVNETDTDGVVTGTWTFQSWAPDSYTIDGADVEFVGTWTYEVADMSYSIVQHFIGSDGVEVGNWLVSAEDATAPYGTVLSTLISGYVDQPADYNSASYVYDTAKVLDSVVTTQKLVANDTVIDLYYDIDTVGPNGGSDGTPDKYQATVTFTVVNGTWTGGGTTRSTVVTLRNAAGEMAADGTYTLRTGDIPTGTANAGYANGVWGANANPNGAVIDRRGASYELTYAPAGTTGPVFPPPDPGPGTGGGTTTIPENPTPLGPDPDGATTILDEEVPLANAVGLNITEHFAYIIGYEDDTVRPLKNITRAEAVTIFFRLMEDDYRAANWSMENPFSDVNAGNWHNNAVSTCLKAGALKHFAQDAAFLPNQAITRAEFASIAAGFVSDEITGESIGDFSDTEGHWAAADIRKAVEAGWIKGVGGNRFAPDETITRAEVMTIVNRMLDRVPDAEHMLPDMKKWLDNPEDAWYYEAVQEATNEHDYDVDEFGAESWTEILEARDWKSLENEWANNGGMSASAEPVKPEEGAEGEGEAEDAGSESEEA